MKSELQKAFEEAAKLPDNEQEALGQWLLEELASERRWDELFLRSSDKLAALGKEALAEYRAGRTQDLAEDLESFGEVCPRDIAGKPHKVRTSSRT